MSKNWFAAHEIKLETFDQELKKEVVSYLERKSFNKKSECFELKDYTSRYSFGRFLIQSSIQRNLKSDM